MPFHVIMGITTMKRIWILIAAAFCLPGLRSEEPAAVIAGNIHGNYVIQTGDEISFAIYDEPDTETGFRVGADGTANFLFLGNVKVTGKTISELREYLYEAYDKDYYVEPQIRLIVISYAQRRVQVIGQVNRPGVVLMPPEQKMSIVEAITLAGGFTRLGNQRNVTVKRVLENGEMKLFEVNVDKILDNPDKEDFILQKGDTINVSERIF